MAQLTSRAIPAIGSAEQRRILVNAEEVRFLRRKISGQIAAALLATFTGLSVAILFIIISYVVVNGIGGINLAFFTEIPKPLGQTGGGISQAILGSLEMLLVGAVISVPLGLM